MTRIASIFLLILFTTPFVTFAQSDSLTLQKLIEEVLRNNYDIAIALNNNKVASNNASKGQAGYYPNVALNANGNYSNNNTNLSFAGGLDPVEVKGAQNTSLGTNIGVNYVLFNGFGRVHTYNSLMARQQLSAVQSQILSENLILDAVNKYLDLQQAILNLKVADENLKISEERLKRTKVANENGVKSKIDLWTAQVDLTNDSLAVLSQKAIIRKQLANLNLVMGRNPSDKLLLINEIPVPEIKDLAEAKNKALQSNATLLLSKISLKLSEESAASIGAQQYPQINLNASYGINSSQNGAGIVLSQKTLGLNSGVTFTMPIFAGNQLTTAMKNAVITSENSELEIKKATQNIEYQFEAAAIDLELLQANILALESNISLAELALKRAALSYNEGLITYNDLRIVQLNVLAAKNRRNEATISLVRLFYGINRLSGELIAN
jgi:outer membrane protein